MSKASQIDAFAYAAELQHLIKDQLTVGLSYFIQVCPEYEQILLNHDRRHSSRNLSLKYHLYWGLCLLITLFIRMVRHTRCSSLTSSIATNASTKELVWLFKLVLTNLWCLDTNFPLDIPLSRRQKALHASATILDYLVRQRLNKLASQNGWSEYESVIYLVVI